MTEVSFVSDSGDFDIVNSKVLVPNWAVEDFVAARLREAEQLGVTVFDVEKLI